MAGFGADLSIREDSRIAILRAWREEIAASYESADAWRQSIMEGQLQPDEHTQEKLALLADFEHSMMSLDATHVARVERQLHRVKRPEFLQSWLDRGHWAQGEALAKQILKQQALDAAIAAERQKRKQERDVAKKRLLKPRTVYAGAEGGSDPNSLMKGRKGSTDDADEAGGEAAVPAGDLLLKPKVFWDKERLSKMATAKQPKQDKPVKEKKRILTSEELAAMLDKHYKQAPEILEAKRRKAREKVYKELGHNTKRVEMTSEQLEQFVRRHAVDIPDQRTKNMETLRKKVLKEASGGKRVGEGTVVNVEAFAQRVDDGVRRLAARREALLLKVEKERAALTGRSERAVLYGDAIARSAEHLFGGEGARDDLVTFEDVAIEAPFEGTGFAAAARATLRSAERSPSRERGAGGSRTPPRSRAAPAAGAHGGAHSGGPAADGGGDAEAGVVGGESAPGTAVGSAGVGGSIANPPAGGSLHGGSTGAPVATSSGVVPGTATPPFGGAPSFIAMSGSSAVLPPTAALSSQASQPGIVPSSSFVARPNGAS